MGSVLSRVFGGKKEDSKADVREPKHRKRWSFRATRRNDDSAVSVPTRSSTLPARAHHQAQDEHIAAQTHETNETAAKPQLRQPTEFEEIDEATVANRVQEILKDVADDEDHETLVQTNQVKQNAEPIQSQPTELHAPNTTEASQVLIKPVEASALVSAALGETLELNEQKPETQVLSEEHVVQDGSKVDEILPVLAEQSQAASPEDQPHVEEGHDEAKPEEVQHDEIEPVVQEPAQAVNAEEQTHESHPEQETGHEEQPEHAETKEAEHEQIEPVTQEQSEAVNPEEHAEQTGQEGQEEPKPEEPENPDLVVEPQEADMLVEAALGESEHAPAPESEQHEPAEEVHADLVEGAQLEAKPSDEEQQPDSGVESHNQETNENEGEQHHEESGDQVGTENEDQDLKSDIDKPAVDAFVTDILTEAQHEVEAESNHEPEGNDTEANHNENENSEHKDEEHSGQADGYDDQFVDQMVAAATNEDPSPNHEEPVENNNHEAGENPEPILEKALNPEENQLVTNGETAEPVANGYQE